MSVANGRCWKNWTLSCGPCGCQPVRLSLGKKAAAIIINYAFSLGIFRLK